MTTHPASADNGTLATTAPDRALGEGAPGRALLELKQITVSFRRPADTPLTIVKGLTLNLKPGELVCIAGRSGSGKTSILRVAAGLTAPTDGTVRWEGTDIATYSPDTLASQRRRIAGILDQGAALLPELSALENVLLAAIPDRRVRKLRHRAESLLDGLGLGDRARHRPGSLSGGERQRTALARALLLNPPLLIVDEPTASLDRRWADTVIGHLTQAAENGIAILAASHDPNLIAAAHQTTPLD